MLYYSYATLRELRLCGEGVDVTFIALVTTEDRTSIDRFFDQTCIPFGQMKTRRSEVTLPWISLSISSSSRI